MKYDKRDFDRYRYEPEYWLMQKWPKDEIKQDRHLILCQLLWNIKRLLSKTSLFSVFPPTRHCVTTQGHASLCVSWSYLILVIVCLNTILSVTWVVHNALWPLKYQHTTIDIAWLLLTMQVIQIILVLSHRNQQPAVHSQSTAASDCIIYHLPLSVWLNSFTK